MNAYLQVINAASVGIFGFVLSAMFCNIKWNKKNKILYTFIVMLLLTVQAVVYTVFDMNTIRRLYPLITHLPLILVLWGLSRDALWSIGSVWTAYLFCQIRRWIALFGLVFCDGTDKIQMVIEIVITIPLAFLIIKYIAPFVRELSQYPTVQKLQFIMIPAIGYIFDYITRIYTNWLSLGIPAVVEFMPFLCAVVYPFFTIQSAKAFYKQSELKQQQTVLKVQVKQSASQLADMKKSQEMAAAYRHDLRHHLQYLSNCIENNDLERAQEYIHSLNETITGQTVKQYCSNTAVNLILSSFAERAGELDVKMSVKVSLGEKVKPSDNDLCVLISNALENALTACSELKKTGKEADISIYGYEKSEKVFMEISNSCYENYVLNEEIPHTDIKGHGIGVRSICAVVEKYGGIYNFEAKNGRFVLRLSI